jgi:hypothetical protein
MKFIDYFISVPLLVTRLVLHKQRTKFDDYKKKENLRKLLTQRFEISKQMVIINASPIHNPKEKSFLGKINEIFYNEPDVDFNWEEFYILLNELYDNFSIKLSRTYPELTKEEIHLCCLMKAGFNTSNICFILSYAPITVRTKKTKIRKKLGITDGGDLNDFLNKFIENN